MEIARTFQLAPQAVPQARREVAKVAEGLPHEVLNDLLLLVSEMMTNSVVHTPPAESQAVTLRLEVGGRRVRITVDGGRLDFEPTVGARGPARESGYGMLIVDTLATRWGKAIDDGVWAEIDFAR